MALSSTKKKALKAQAHHLKPVIRIGQKGLSDAVIEETRQALESHELLKVHIADDDRAARRAVSEQLAVSTASEVISRIGKTFVLYHRKQA